MTTIEMKSYLIPKESMVDFNYPIKLADGIIARENDNGDCAIYFSNLASLKDSDVLVIELYNLGLTGLYSENLDRLPIPKIDLYKIQKALMELDYTKVILNETIFPELKEAIETIFTEDDMLNYNFIGGQEASTRKCYVDWENNIQVMDGIQKNVATIDQWLYHITVGGMDLSKEISEAYEDIHIPEPKYEDMEGVTKKEAMLVKAMDLRNILTTVIIYTMDMATELAAASILVNREKEEKS
jgi:hypothetical protein